MLDILDMMGWHFHLKSISRCITLGNRYTLFMVSFAQPWFLSLMPVVVGVGYLFNRMRAPAIAHPLAFVWLDLPQPWRVRVTRWSERIVPGLIVALFVVAIANPRRPDLKTQIPVEGITIVLVLDVSGSMDEIDFVPNAGSPPISRLDAAKQALRLFVAGGDSPDGLHFDGRPNDQIGVVTFALFPTTICPPTLNHNVVIEVIRDMKSQGGTSAGTNIGDSIGEGLIRLQNSGDTRKKVLVLLSDGEHNKIGEDVLHPKSAAALAAQLQIPIHTIDCGGDPPVNDPMAGKQRAEGRREMAEVAAITGGQSFVANNGTDLRATFESIDKLERLPTSSHLYRRYTEFGWWFGAVGLLLLIVYIVANATILRRLP